MLKKVLSECNILNRDTRRIHDRRQPDEVPIEDCFIFLPLIGNFIPAKPFPEQERRKAERRKVPEHPC